VTIRKKVAVFVSHHYHVAIKEFGHLLTHSGLTRQEVFSFVPSAFWGVVFISLGRVCFFFNKITNFWKLVFLHTLWHVLRNYSLHTNRKLLTVQEPWNPPVTSLEFGYRILCYFRSFQLQHFSRNRIARLPQVQYKQSSSPLWGKALHLFPQNAHLHFSAFSNLSFCLYHS
jgi:hypothetical protein